MTIIKYTKSDLMWEATRRNENYKTDYSIMLEKYMKDFKVNVDMNIEYLPYISSERWNIFIIKEDSTGAKIYGWLDPSIDIDKIKKEIGSGINPFSVHPYAYIQQLNITNPNIYYHHLDRKGGLGYFSEHQIGDDIYVCIKADFIRNKFLFLIDPMSEDESILKSVQETKRRVLKSIKEETESLKGKKDIIFYPRDIEKYIGWLKKYDAIVNHLIKNRGKGSLIFENGTVVVPEDFRFGELVPNDTPGDKFEGQRKAYRDAYKGAVKLIKNTPNIVFSPSRT